MSSLCDLINCCLFEPLFCFSSQHCIATPVHLHASHAPSHSQHTHCGTSTAGCPTRVLTSTTEMSGVTGCLPTYGVCARGGGWDGEFLLSACIHMALTWQQMQRRGVGEGSWEWAWRVPGLRRVRGQGKLTKASDSTLGSSSGLQLFTAIVATLPVPLGVCGAVPDD